MDTKKKAPENTSRNTLGVMLPTGDSKVGQEILRQEAKGQQSFLASDTLPTDMLSNHHYDARAILEAAGVVFGAVVEGDPLFQYAELPSGWRKEADEDDSEIRSYLIDDQGRKRAYIIYEPIFYKRNALLRLISRFKHCQWYEDKMKEKGGIDLQILGIGSNGHIGFNEPCSAFDSRTRLVDLTKQTIKDNSRFFENSNSVPKQAMTMGLATIMQAKQIILLASGSNKAEIVSKALTGSITEEVPASILQNHNNLIVVLDKKAFIELKKDS